MELNKEIQWSDDVVVTIDVTGDEPPFILWGCGMNERNRWEIARFENSAMAAIIGMALGREI